jgi:alkyl sulfatase BDS1-like metallo-beta-lactamase superfamily hydrolase
MPDATPRCFVCKREVSDGHRRREGSVFREGASVAMTRSISGFFDELASRGHEPLLWKVTGSARFDVVAGQRTEHWLVTIDKGDIRVSRGNAAAGSVLRADKASFDRIVAGELNLMAAVLRGEVAVEGDPRLVVRLQRLFPRPQGERTLRQAGSARREE